MHQQDNTKKFLRQNAMAYRQTLAPAARAQLDAAIQGHLLTVLQSHGPCTVGVFSPCQGEPNILPLMQHLCLQAWRWALPVCVFDAQNPKHPHHLQFAAYAPGDALQAGAYGIAVPVLQHWVQPQLVLVPCVAFHASGARVGYGAGWYDKTLVQMQGVGRQGVYSLGVAYAATQTEIDFAQAHDVRLHGVVTEFGVLFPGDAEGTPAWEELKALLGTRIQDGLAGNVSTKSIKEILDDELPDELPEEPPKGRP